MTFQSRLRQPTTMLGLAIIVAAGLLAAFGLIPVGAFAALLAPAGGLIFVNDNTGFSADAQTLALDAVTSATQNHLSANLPRLVNEAMKAAGDLTKTAAVLMLLIGTSLVASGCQSQTFTSDSAVACQADGVLQPIAAATLTALVPEAAGAMSIDALVVHPAVVKLCAAMNATPVANPSVPPASVSPPAPVIKQTSMSLPARFWAGALTANRAWYVAMVLAAR